jgi:amino-acid N-acetyltransferase
LREASPPGLNARGRNPASDVKPTDLRGILQYIPRFRERTFVISLDGAIVTDENFANILMDVAVLRSLSIRVALVHGASAQIRRLGEEQAVTPSNLDGAGVTDAATLQLALTASSRLTQIVRARRRICAAAARRRAPGGILQVWTTS